ncbi:hypothetical protein AK88_00965 [Plasmodium fragile]|uniref:Uncharacterized protein n=1 Tax=Plasmodium fragile TaxID=5857 RepID=A0A0D9QQU9_PLAFR|nr:uncharacterized protein AK88_00965 [Plasmodium fragile]KJP89303.1 hypothetical protein AK88_00965 [Plasmodium fragile]
MRDKEEIATSRGSSCPKQADWSRINFTFLVFVLGIKTVFCILLFLYHHVLLFFIFFMSTVISLYSLLVNTFKALALYIVILTSILTSILLSLFNIIQVEYISNVFKEVVLSTVSYSVLPLFILEFFVAIIYTCLKRRKKGYIQKSLRELKIIVDGSKNKDKEEHLLSLKIDLEKNELNTCDKTYKYYLTNYKNKKYICIEKKTDYSSGEEDRSSHHIGNDYTDYNDISSKYSTLKNQQSSNGKKAFHAGKNAHKGSHKSDSLSYYHVSEDLSFMHSGIKKYAKKNEKNNAKKKKSGGKGKAAGDTHTVGSCGDGSHMHSASPHTKGRKSQWSNDKHSITDKDYNNLDNNEREDEEEGTSIISQEFPSEMHFLTQQVERRNSNTRSNGVMDTLQNHAPDQRENSKKDSSEYIKNSFSLDNYEEVNHIIEKFIEKNKGGGTPSVDLTCDLTKKTEKQNDAQATEQKMDEVDTGSRSMQMNDSLAQKVVPQDETTLGAVHLTPLQEVCNQVEKTHVKNDEEKEDHLLSHMTSQVEEELIKIITNQTRHQPGGIYAECTAEEKDSGQFADIEDHHIDIVAKFEAQKNNQGYELHSNASKMEANQKKQSHGVELDPSDIPNKNNNPLLCVPANMEQETKQVGGTNEKELLMSEQKNSQSEVTPVISPKNQAGKHTEQVEVTHDGDSYTDVQVQIEQEIKEQPEDQSEQQWNELPTEQPSELPSYLPAKLPSGEPSQLHIEELADTPSPALSNMPNDKEGKDDGDEDKGDNQSDNTSESKKTHEGEKQVRNVLCTNLEETNLLRSASYVVDTKQWIKLEKKDIEMLKQSVNINNIEHIPIDDFYTKNIKERGANLFSYSIDSSNMSEFLKIGVDQMAYSSWGAQQEESLTSSNDICKKINFANLENKKNNYVTLFDDGVIPRGGLNEKEKVTELLNLQQSVTSHLDYNKMDSVHQSSHVGGANQTGEKNLSNGFQSGEDSNQKWSQKEELDHGEGQKSNEKGPYASVQMHNSSNTLSSNLYTTEQGEYKNYEEVSKDNSNNADAFVNNGMYGEKSEMGKSNMSDELPPNSFDNTNDNVILTYSSYNDDMQSVPNSHLIVVKEEHFTKESENSTSILNGERNPSSGNTNEPPKCMDDKDTNKEQKDTQNICSNDMCETTSIFKQRKSFFENLKKDKPLSSHPAKMLLSNERNVLKKVTDKTDGDVSRMVSAKSEGDVLNSNSSINQYKKENIPIEESNVNSSTPEGEHNETNTETPLEKFAQLKKAKNISHNFYIINDKLKSSGKEKKDTSAMGISPNEQLTPSNELPGSSTSHLPNQVKENEMEKMEKIENTDEVGKEESMNEMTNTESKQKITQHFVIYDQSDLAEPSSNLDEGTPTMGETHNLGKKKKIEGTIPNTVITVNNYTINSSVGVHIIDGKKTMFTSATQLSKDSFMNLGKAEKIIHDVKTEGSYHDICLHSQVQEVPTFGSSEEPNFQYRKKKFTELKKKTTPMNSNPLNDTPTAEVTNSMLHAFADINSDDTKGVLPSEHMQSELVSSQVMNSEACPYSADLLPSADNSFLVGSTEMDNFKDDFFNMNSCDSSVMYRDFMDAMNPGGQPEVEQAEEAEVEEVEIEEVQLEDVDMEYLEVDEVPELVEVLSEPMEAASKSEEAPHEQAGNNLPHETLHSAEEDANLESENIHLLDDLPTQKTHLKMEKTNTMGNANPSCDVSSGVHTDKHEAGDTNDTIDHLKEDQSPDTATDMKENYTKEMCTKNGAEEQPFSDDKAEGEEKPNEELSAEPTLQEELTAKDNFEGDETQPSYPHEEDTPLGDAAIYECNEIPPIEEKKEDITSSPTEQAIDNLENVIEPPMVEASTGGGEPKEEVPPHEETSGDGIVGHNNDMHASGKVKPGMSESRASSNVNHERAKNYKNRKNNKWRHKRR